MLHTYANKQSDSQIFLSFDYVEKYFKLILLILIFS